MGRQLDPLCCLPFFLKFLALGRGTSVGDLFSINLGPPTIMSILYYVCLKLYPYNLFN